MSFGFPLGLLGLLSLPVILVLHMRRARRKPFLVSSLLLWSFTDPQTASLRPRRVPVTWLLALDLAGAALLSLALAQPRLHLNPAWGQGRHVLLLLDVSTSMHASDELPSRLDKAKAGIAGRIGSLRGKDSAALVTFGRTARWIGDTGQGGQAGLLALLEQVPGGGTGQSLEEALAIGLASRPQDKSLEVVVFTDAAYPSPGRSLAALPYPVEWVQLGGNTGNQAVISLNITPIGQKGAQVFARIANLSARQARRTAILEVDGAPAGQVSLSIPADSSVVQVWQVSSSARQVQVALEGSDALPDDDRAFAGSSQGGPLSVTLVADNPAPLQQALQAVPGVQLRVTSVQEYQAGGAASSGELTVFRGFLPPAWPAGAVLVVEPPAGEAASGNLLASTGRAPVPASAPLRFPEPDPLPAGVDFSGVRWGRAWQLAGLPAGYTPILQAGSQPLLLRGPAVAGKTGPLWVLLADLDSGNFTRHPAFPILMANLVQSARLAPFPSSLPAGEPLTLPASGSLRTLRISPPAGRPQSYAGSWPAAWEEALHPGLVQVDLLGLDGSQASYSIGVNAGDAVESDLRPRAWLAEAQAAGERQAATAATGSLPPGQEPVGRALELLPFLLAGVVVVLMTEAVLAWR